MAAVENPENLDGELYTYANGFRFTGWGYSEDGTTLKEWKETNPVNEDLTLYATWDYDRFDFLNSDNAFDPSGTKTNLISGKYLDALQTGLTDDQWAEVASFMNSKWSGSCFGMSALYCLRYAGRIDPAKFQSGAAVLHDFTAPVRSNEVWNLINYYFIQQARPESSGFTSSDNWQMYEDHKANGRNNARYAYPDLIADGTYSRCLVEDLTHSKQPSIICFYLIIRMVIIMAGMRSLGWIAPLLPMAIASPSGTRMTIRKMTP